MQWEASGQKTSRLVVLNFLRRRTNNWRGSCPLELCLSSGRHFGGGKK